MVNWLIMQVTVYACIVIVLSYGGILYMEPDDNNSRPGGLPFRRGSSNSHYCPAFNRTRCQRTLFPEDTFLDLNGVHAGIVNGSRLQV